MLKYRNFGKQSLKEITEILHGMGLHLGMDIDAILEGRAPKPAPVSVEPSIDELEVENS
jgi:DNA-directed RNA polymerase alpha subunit